MSEGPIILPIVDRLGRALLRCNAYHESGHAIAGLAMGRHVEYLEVLQDRRHGGLCVSRDGHATGEEAAVVSAAGDVAEQTFCQTARAIVGAADPQAIIKIMAALPDVEPTTPTRPELPDDRFTRLAARIAIGGADEVRVAEVVEHATQAARLLLLRHAAAVERVAEALIRERRLSGERVAKLFNRSHHAGMGRAAREPALALACTPTADSSSAAPSTSAAARSGAEWQGRENERKALSGMWLVLGSTGPSGHEKTDADLGRPVSMHKTYQKSGLLVDPHLSNRRI